MSPSTLLSIVVPIAPGETEWAELLDSLKPLPAGVELFLVFSDKRDKARSGSIDEQIVSLFCPGDPQRARSMNHGAEKANGEFLWFLHADSRLSDRVFESLFEKLPGLGSAIWYFDLKFRPDGPALMVVNAIGVWIRCRIFKMPFGDQGLLMRKADFERLGGYLEDAGYGEDHLLVWRARQSGMSIKPLRLSIQTSARKYREEGWLKTTGRHIWLTWKQALPELVKLITGKRP